MLLALTLAIACSGAPQGGDSDAPLPVDCERRAWYPDGDGDGWGVGLIGTTACRAPAGYTDAGGDCDDADPTIHPNQAELCDEVDQDCDDRVDEDLATELVFLDEDGDGYGDGRVAACGLRAGLSAVGGDCDDGRADVSPESPEVCDGVDNDCDGLVDISDASLQGVRVWFPDEDSDGYGGLNRAVYACFAPPGYADNDQDCDDNDSSVNPAQTERCYDGVDQDCDGRTDDYTGDCFVSTSGPACTDGPVSPTLCGPGVAVVGDAVSYGRVQDALDGAGEVLLTLCPGRYAGPFVARGSVAMVGFGAGVSVLDGAGGPVFSLPAGSSLALSALTAEGGGGSSGGVLSGEDLQICASGVGFGFNTVSDDGGVFALSGSGTLDLVGCVLSANGAGDVGGAVALAGAYQVESIDTLWVSNDAGREGGALWSDAASEAYFGASWLLRNSAGGGGAVSTAGLLQSVGSDWGAGADDNSPEDLLTAGGSYRFGAEDFACDGAGLCE